MAKSDSEMLDCIEVVGAREHNLKNISVKIPREKLTVVTGLSGSGKSSLAFDTIFAEGQRRYIESFAAYARQFLGNMERPDVDEIAGLSPVISIEQKTTGRNRRSTVGTITEVYDLFRLLFARASEAYSYVTGNPMVSYTDDEIQTLIGKQFNGKSVLILAPVVKGRKGHYRELFEKYMKAGFLRARIDGEVTELKKGLQLDRYKIHDIEIVIDKLKVSPSADRRLRAGLDLAMKNGKGSLIIYEDEDHFQYYSRDLVCPTSGISYDIPSPNMFSFNSPYGACPDCNGLGTIIQVDENKIIPNRKKSIKAGGIEPLGKYRSGWIFSKLDALAGAMGFDLGDKIESLSEEQLHAVLYGTTEVFGGKSGGLVGFEGVITSLSRYIEDESGTTAKKWKREFTNEVVCPKCNGGRLKEQTSYFKFAGKTIVDIAAMTISQLNEWLKNLDNEITGNQKKIADEILKEIGKKVDFLLEVGLDYLHLNRSAATLSGGESQRIRLATQIGSQLTGVLYILDEPSIGLHQRDNQRLINALHELKGVGNTILVVEHDKDMILSADYVLDIGPGAGRFGGEIMAAGTPKQILKNKGITSEYLNGKREIAVPEKRRKGNGKKLKLTGAKGHNLQGVDISIPLGCMVCVTGVSGSGKSSLINGTLYPILNSHFYNGVKKPLEHKSLKGLEHLDKVIEIDQAPIGRTPRSNPSTYIGVFSDIRTLFARLPEAMIRGYKPGRFSFNVAGGRCETCKGAGLKVIEMNFLPDVLVECDECQGKRYNRETLEIRYKGKSISDVLDMSVSEATEFFESVPQIHRKIKALKDVGLGYIKLGQSSTTLSGGEAQRVKLSSELHKKDTGKTFYILDEPTTGLHFEDVKILLGVLNNLVEKGNTVLIIEHNMDVIKVADYLFDLGPDGGDKGGQLVAEGTPEQVCKVSESITGTFLKEEL